MLKVEHLFAGYDSKIVLKDISLQFHRGTVTALLGPNGSGKSTLLKAIDGIIKPDNGAIILDTMNIDAMTKNDIAQSIAYFLGENHIYHLNQQSMTWKLLRKLLIILI